VAEAVALRQAGIDTPVLVLGPSLREECQLAAQFGLELTVGSLAGAQAVAEASQPGNPLRVHIKVETGVYRQGITADELPSLLEILTSAPAVSLVGLSSHYADIEDTTDHAYARGQAEQFAEFSRLLAAAGHGELCRHMSCSAAAILWPASHLDIVRVGIAGYGIWPSSETFISARETGQNQLDLRPAMTWKCHVVQVKDVPTGQTVGYGRSWKAPVASRIAVLPVGYSDGYPRALSNRAHVLVRGCPAPIRGRICMNLCMVDVTHIPGVQAGDEVVLLGQQKDEEITAEQLAELLNTIPYEILTLLGATWQRIPV
jgi:alanine racemase